MYFFQFHKILLYMLKRPDLLQLSVAEKDTLIAALFDQWDAMNQTMQVMRQTIQAMQSRIDVLEGPLRKDSHNSHKPPSSDVFGKKQADEAKSEERAIGRKRLVALRQAYESILREGEKDNPLSCIRKGARGKVKQTPAVNLLKRLRQQSEDVLRFLEDLTVRFDNNQAERDIRMSKLKQKISGGFRTVTGADAFAVIRSYAATLRKQKRYVFVALTGV